MCYRNMIRRSPTRIDLRLDDLTEYEAMKKEKESKKENEKSGPTNPPSWGGKVSQTEIQERIGYVPQTPQSAHTGHPRANMTM